ncbi:uncharacterized protein LOC128550506 [Mercenaria mercenaria]|uniref:uncharacterized protein LOC128550506 n=1 Tax=Mercenaria mercenaria TaxID=6596 RepID=UPI00234F8C74|nr:uncharacterized protein LOC128550506 [Mercenaria mercenaria]
MGSGISKSSFDRRPVENSSVMKSSDEYHDPEKSIYKNIGNTGNPQPSGAAMKIHINPKASDQRDKDEFTFINKINVKASTDEKDCFIESMALVSSNKLAIVDNYNRTLKVVDTDNKTIKKAMKFQSSPFGITTISCDQVAVTFPKECKIEIVSTSEDISLVETLKTNGSCLGICFKNEKLYVSYLPMPPNIPIKFQILRLTGAVQKTIRPDSEVLKYSTYPSCIAVSPEENSVFVSDWKCHKVFCIDMDGNMLSMYQDELEHPSDIFMSLLGSVYLLNKGQHLLYEVKSDLSEATVLLGIGDGLAFPNAMCFNLYKQHLYISAGSDSAKLNNEIKVYIWK